MVLRIRAARAPPLGLADTGGAGAVRHRRLHLLLPYYLVTERPPRPRRHGRAVVPPTPRPQMPAGLGRRHGGRQEEQEEDDAQERDDHAGRGASLRHAHTYYATRSIPGRLRGPHFVVPDAPAEARVRTVVDQVEVPDDSDPMLLERHARVYIGAARRGRAAAWVDRPRRAARAVVVGQGYS